MLQPSYLRRWHTRFAANDSAADVTVCDAVAEASAVDELADVSFEAFLYSFQLTR